MEKIYNGKNIVFYLIFFILCIPIIKAKYKEIDLKLKKGETDNNLPLYIETSDSCSKWIPSLFSPILIINEEVKTENYSLTSFKTNIQNPYSIMHNNKPLKMDIYIHDISIFNKIYIAKSNVLWPENCLFGLDYSEIKANEKNLNAIQNLIPGQIDKFIFSFEKWDINKQNFIYSKFYIGDSHENFLNNVGTCNIQNGTGYYGCIFNDFVFLNETYSLMNENNKSYIIYFASEFNQIYFPNNFKNKFKNCHLEENLVKEFICEDLKNKDYLPLKLRNDNMNITLEVDRKNRFSADSSTSNGVTDIIFHDFDYIIFPLIMLKNFHTQFDVEKKVISFFTNDTKILELKKEEPQKTDEPKNDSNGNGISTGLLILLIILGILLLAGIGYGGFLLYRKRNLTLEKKFNKYSRFEDEEGDHSLMN